MTDPPHSNLAKAQSPADPPKPRPATGSLPQAAAKLVLPPGYDKAAAASAARRYSRWRSMVGLRGGPTQDLQGEQIELLRSADQRSTGIGAVWLGHATVLLRLGERWILTDPVFSSRIGVHLGPLTMGVPRQLPAVAHVSLPRPDIILISHAHFDHLDVPSLRALAHRQTRVVTARGTKGLIPRGFGDVQELDWDQTLTLDSLALRALRPAHWGARAIWDKHRGFNSYLLRATGPVPSTILFAGDTAHSSTFAGVGPIDLSIFGIGAYDPWIQAHATPEQVWHMHLDAQGQFLLPMHHSTFVLSDEPLDEPMRRLLVVAGELESRVVGRELGLAWVRQAPSLH